MELNSLVFSRPFPTYTSEDYKGELIRIPNKKYFQYRDRIKYSSDPVKNVYFKKEESQLESEYCDTTYINNNLSEVDSEIFLFDKNKPKHVGIQKIPSLMFTMDNKFDDYNKNEKESFIPCLFFKGSGSNRQKIIVYFHSNSEDLGSTHTICSTMSKKLHISVLSVEFPSYGIYKDSDCTSDMILKDADVIYNFLTDVKNIKEKNIIFMGRCIGSGPASFLAAKYTSAALVLISPFISIKAAAKSIFSNMKIGWIVEKLVKERFSNIENIEKIKCPLLIIHGKRDEIIPWEHSLELINKCFSPAKLVAPELMSHNSFNLNRDVINYIKDFFELFLNNHRKSLSLCKYNFLNNEVESQENIDFPYFMFYYK